MSTPYSIFRKIRTPTNRFKASLRRNPQWPSVLFEGDSWLAYPGSNLKHAISAILSNRLNALPLQSNGDEIANMLSGRSLERLRYRLRATAFDAIVFSGGGNDVLGQIDQFLQRGHARDGWQSWINCERFASELAAIRQAYLRLVDIRDQGKNPACPILAHGYDYPIPAPRPFRMLGGLIKIGPWLYPPLKKLGVPPAHQRAIARWMIERFNAVLAELASECKSFHHIATPGTLEASDWADEIHPAPAPGGFGKLAARFRPALSPLI